MNRNTKIAAAIAAAAIIGFAAGSASQAAQAEAQKQHEARRAAETASLALCEQAGGRWGHNPNGSPRCDTHAIVKTRRDDGRCPEAQKRTEAGIAVCDEPRE